MLQVKPPEHRQEAALLAFRSIRTLDPTIRHIQTATLLVLVIATALLGCKDGAGPTPFSAAVDRARVATTGERLPENDVHTALKNHGAKQLFAWAEAGDKKAQFFVAVAYLDGTEVPKNFEAAAKWALRAANQGSPAAQYLVGMLRKDAALGEDLLALEPNLIRGYMWLSLAAAQGHQRAREDRDKVQNNMEAAWVIKAQSLAAAWRACSEPACQDQEPDPGPPSHCKDRPKSVLCP